MAFVETVASETSSPDAMRTTPNKTSQATPVFAILFVSSQVSGAPECFRWANLKKGIA
jgi:hypothetical protein